MRESKYILVSLLCLVAVTFGCSRSNIEPITISEINNDRLTELIESNHSLIGSYKLKFDLDTLECNLSENRDLNAHYNVKGYIPPPVIVINGWSPVTEIMDLDVTINNSTALKVYDVRLIIYTDNIGHMLINDDNWTSLYDIAGGMNINPFKRYVNSLDGGFNAHSYDVRNIQLLLPGGNTSVYFAIDASFPGHCEEPWGIRDFSQDVLYDTPLSTADVEVYVDDWQDNSMEVWMECPDVFGASPFEFTAYGTGYFDGTITNYTGALEGTYQAIIWATSASTSIKLYDVVEIKVSHYMGNGWVETRGGVEDDIPFGLASHTIGDVFFGYASDIDIDEENTFTYRYNADGGITWANSVTGFSGTRVMGCDLHFDGYNSVYVTGFYQGQIDFNPGAGVDYHYPYSDPVSEDMFITKYTAGSSYIWTKSRGTDGDDRGLAVATDDSGYVCTGGIEMMHYPSPDHGYYDRIAPDGTLVYHGTIGHPTGTITYPMYVDMVSDGNGNMICVGTFTSLIDLQPGIGEYILDSIGSRDTFICKYDPDADLIWAYQLGGSSLVWVTGVFVDSNGDIYLSGGYLGTIDFDPGTGEALKSSGGDYDAFLSKYNSNCVFQWVLTIGGTGKDYCNGVSVTNDGNIYATGYFNNIVDFDPGSGIYNVESNGDADSFVLKLDASANFVWVRTFGHSGYDAGTHIVNDSSGNIFVAGQFSDGVDFDPGSGQDIRNTQGTGDLDTFLLKLLPNGYWE